MKEFTDFTDRYITGPDVCCVLGRLRSDDTIEIAAKGVPSVLSDMAVGILKHNQNIDVQQLQLDALKYQKLCTILASQTATVSLSVLSEGGDWHRCTPEELLLWQHN